MGPGKEAAISSDLPQPSAQPVSRRALAHPPRLLLVEGLDPAHELNALLASPRLGVGAVRRSRSPALLAVRSPRSAAAKTSGTGASRFGTRFRSRPHSAEAAARADSELPKPPPQHGGVAAPSRCRHPTLCNEAAHAPLQLTQSGRKARAEIPDQARNPRSRRRTPDQGSPKTVSPTVFRTPNPESRIRTCNVHVGNNVNVPPEYAARALVLRTHACVMVL